MFSTDRTLLGDSGYGGDAQERHAAYGKYVDSLDIVVFSKRKYKKNKISNNVWAIPTDSCCKLTYMLDAYKQGEAILKNKKIDLIAAQDPHFTGVVACGLSKHFKVPFTVNAHGDFFGSKHWRQEQWRNKILYYLGKFIVRQANGIRVTSEVIKKSVSVILNEAKRSEESRDPSQAQDDRNSKIQIIPTPVDLKKFQKFDFAQVNKIKEKYQDRQIVLFVGRLVKAKDLPVLLKAVKKIETKFTLLIIGKGEEEKELKSLRDRLGLQDVIDFIGRVDYDDLPNYYRACDFLVLPSNNESFGKVLLEVAMAEKTAVVTDTAGAKEIIENKKNGFVVPIGNIDKLAEKISELLKNQNLAEQMGKENFRMVLEKFGYEKNVNKIIDFWKISAGKEKE